MKMKTLARLLGAATVSVGASEVRRPIFPCPLVLFCCPITAQSI